MLLTGKCKKLILEDAPFFSCVGEERYNTYNYKDLSSVCHEFLVQDQEKDFVYYYVNPLPLRSKLLKVGASPSLGRGLP